MSISEIFPAIVRGCTWIGDRTGMTKAWNRWVA